MEFRGCEVRYCGECGERLTELSNRRICGNCMRVYGKRGTVEVVDRMIKYSPFTGQAVTHYQGRAALESR